MAMAPIPPPHATFFPDSALESITAHVLSIADAAQEIAIFVYLDPQWRVLGLRQVSNGAVDALTLSLRDIVADVLAHDAVAVAMAHNHPSGDPTPSDADYRLTRRSAQTLDAIGVRLVEHLVLARDRRESFRARGLL